MGNIFELDYTCINNRLERWARWKMSAGVALGYPSSSAFTVLRVDNQGVEDTHIADDTDCIQTNEAINQLGWVLMMIVRAEYLEPIRTAKQRAMKCGISEKDYRTKLKKTKKIIASNINIVLTKCHKSDIKNVN